MKKYGDSIRLLLTGGGTGGHLFPAIATAEELCSRLPGSTVMFIGTKRKIDTTSLTRYGYAVKSIHCYGLKGKSLPHLLKAVAALPLALLQSIRIIRSYRPDVVLGVGGYVTGPVIFAARILGIKTVIHEQNSIPGLANRKLGSLAEKICISLPQSGVYFPQNKTVFTGNPVRKPILQLGTAKRDDAVKNKKTLLVLGGSQGAHGLNTLMTEALCHYGLTMPFTVIHQTGIDDCDVVRRQYAKSGIDSRVEPFFHDMAEIYQEADLLVSRAGATTLAEIAVLGLPAFLVPYPYAADNHQQKNAEHYVNGGGCRSCPEKELTGKLLAENIEELLKNEVLYRGMSARMRALAVPEAASRIVDVCLDGGMASTH
ncbi:MAG: undecaprenyldiphospho-muramoylpentapeptide beta-N-acetylglucosaminyltransferase [Desulfopila sp.]|jgi:UDP-N-acetylglucosamine--N-acetylmuramyl-(pentapeptide) pyrophosphoryl-undecaprenol N-acetylglucosamine transferase|nr:undecaprenyldiphospho-muramoylpentapeptide beta-N-acetylglucosaminyltransferase [Desulfopila sp.]